MIRSLLALVARILGSRNPNGRGIWRCTCCGCPDGCDEHCAALARTCRVHGMRLPAARLAGVVGSTRVVT